MASVFKMKGPSLYKKKSCGSDYKKKGCATCDYGKKKCTCKMVKTDKEQMADRKAQVGKMSIKVKKVKRPEVVIGSTKFTKRKRK